MMQINFEDVKQLYLRDTGWMQVAAMEEIFFTIGENKNDRKGKKAWKVTAQNGETMIITPGMIEAVQ